VLHLADDAGRQCVPGPQGQRCVEGGARPVGCLVLQLEDAAQDAGVEGRGGLDIAQARERGTGRGSVTGRRRADAEPADRVEVQLAARERAGGSLAGVAPAAFGHQRKDRPRRDVAGVVRVARHCGRGGRRAPLPPAS